MGDPGYSRDGQPMTTPHQEQIPMNYKFTKEELRVLNECNSESFYQRSVPIGSALGLSTYMAVQRGMLKASASFGAAPKVGLAVLAGYFIGKLSYQQKCAEKLMSLPDSYIGKLLRERKAGTPQSASMKGSVPSITMFGANPGDIYSDAGPGSSLDIDTDRPAFSADDTDRPTSSPSMPDQPIPSKPALTYDELRKKNRGEYSEARQNPYSTDPLAAAPLGPAPPVTRARPSPHSTNKYGDVID